MTDIYLRDLFRLVLRKWWIIFICVAVLSAASYIWTNYFVVPTYTASTTLYVGKNPNRFGIQSDDLYLGMDLINDYREIAKSRSVVNKVIEELGLDIKTEDMAKKIKVNQPEMTRVIEISATDPDPQMAMNITDTMAEVFRRKVIEIMQLENVQIIDKAELPTYPTSPNKMINYLVGVVMGLVSGVALIFVIDYIDDTIKTPEDVQKYTGLPVIGIIPVLTEKGRRP